MLNNMLVNETLCLRNALYVIILLLGMLQQNFILQVIPAVIVVTTALATSLGGYGNDRL